MKSLTKVLLDTFYHLNKEYGTTIQFTKTGKGNIDATTGSRDTSGDRSFPLSAVLAPVGHTTEWLAKLLGRTERIESCYLIRVRDLPTGLQVAPEDFFVHGNVKYRNLKFEDYDGTLILLMGESFT